MANFFEKFFRFKNKKSTAQHDFPKADYKNNRPKFGHDSVVEFANKLLQDFKSRSYKNLNDEQKAILEELQHQLKQDLKALQKEGNNADKYLQEIAHEIFVIACASEISLEEVAQFFADGNFSVADLNKFKKGGKLNALAAALLGGRGKKFLKWLIALGANVNFQSPDGNNLAHFAASIDVEAEMMEFLITECGADINAVNQDGMTALDIALMRIDRDLAGCLRVNGGETKFAHEKVVDKEIKSEAVIDKDEMLYDAVLNGDVSSVNSLLLDGANANSMKHGETILQTAAKTGNWAITEKIADHANITTKENVRGVSDAMGQMIDNAGSKQTHVDNPFHHGHHAADIKSHNNSHNNSQGGGLAR